MNGLMRQEPHNQIHATLWGPGAEAQLTLHIPNSKDFYDIRECEFYKELKTFQYQSINDTLFSELYYLKDKIKDYCYAYNFVTYESQPALELFVDDTRDRIRKW